MAKRQPPQRTTKAAGKLVVLHHPEEEYPIGSGLSSAVNFYHNYDTHHQYHYNRYAAEQNTTRSRHSFQPAFLETSAGAPTSRVTAYCTASYYRADYLFQYLSRRSPLAKRFDECTYYRQPTMWSSYVDSSVSNSSRQWRDSFSASAAPSRLESVFEHEEHLQQKPLQKSPILSPQTVSYKETFYMDYGVVVFWGYDEEEERDILKALHPFEVGKLLGDDVELESFQVRYDPDRTPKIFNDMYFLIFLSDSDDVTVKLAISLAVSQSVKLALFENQVDETIEDTQNIPEDIAKYGVVKMSRAECIRLIGHLFNLRTNIVLSSCILDRPELLWTERGLAPLYDAVSCYLEISQRVNLLQNRILVISDLLDMLNEYITKSHGEYLEWIVIWLVFGYCVIALLEVFIKTNKHH